MQGVSGRGSLQPCATRGSTPCPPSMTAIMERLLKQFIFWFLFRRRMGERREGGGPAQTSALSLYSCPHYQALLDLKLQKLLFCGYQRVKCHSKVKGANCTPQVEGLDVSTCINTRTYLHIYVCMPCILRIYAYIYVYFTPYIFRNPYICIQHLYVICKELRKAIYTPYILHMYKRRINIYTELANPIYTYILAYPYILEKPVTPN